MVSKNPKADIDALFTNAPANECEFYQLAFANFLYAVQPETNAKQPRFLGYKTYTGLFGTSLSVATPKETVGKLSLTPRLVKEFNGPGDFDGIEQAGFSGVLVDQSGNPVYYAMHFNDVYSDFIHQKNFLDRKTLLAADPNKTTFPTGAIEFKSAWRVKPDGETEESFRSRYITVQAQLPTLIQDGKKIKVDATKPVTKLVGLIGLHVVVVAKDHPEFVWATFEHIKNAPDGKDPSMSSSADPVDPTTPDFILYQKGKSYRDSNPVPATIAYTLNTDGTVSPATSVYRVFPANDDQVNDLSGSVISQLANTVFAQYKMIGAVWIDKPENFVIDTSFDDKVLAGENRLSSTSMESFTQEKKVNCFSCHDTQAKGNLPASKLAISHALKKFVDAMTPPISSSQPHGVQHH